MRNLRLVLDLQTAMGVTEIVQSYREPTHPAVIPRRFGKSQRLTPLALIAQATGAILPVAVGRRITPPAAVPDRSVPVFVHSAPQYLDACHAYPAGDSPCSPASSHRG